ncbi:MAG: tRNA (guanosine(46)-N7)-methyltransferase TrmB [Alphaproteobacteria bacterium]|nr:tRNA (guanosine(46)-N7)-methyltransferase TrmB [Alphaproteobacteria bacterium]
MSKQPPLTISGEPRAFFGRRAGKTLRGRQQGLIDTLLPRLAIVLPEHGELDPRALFASCPAEIVLEIGFGGGEHLARKASENPETGYIGAEVFANGIGKMLERIDADGLANIRLFTDDALKLLQALPDGALAGVHLIYPDPWPKTRHHKRRFVSPMTLAELVRTIRPGGFFRFATDIEDYAVWTLAHVLRSKGLCWQHGVPGSWHRPYPDWQPTRYEEKARAEGRLQSWYFTFLRL